jgi:hypothetical protein
MKNKNRNKSIIEQVELVFEDEIYELAEAVAEKSQTTPTLTDPFEDYVEVVRSKIHSNPHVFKSRLVKGYNALLYQLHEGEGSQQSSSGEN